MAFRRRTTCSESAMESGAEPLALRLAGVAATQAVLLRSWWQAQDRPAAAAVAAAAAASLMKLQAAPKAQELVQATAVGDCQCKENAHSLFIRQST